VNLYRIEKNGVVVVRRVEVATTILGRLIGLLGRRDLPAGHAVYLAPCNCIHTFFMRFPLDVVFLGRSLEVRRVVRNVPPWRVVGGSLAARGVVEMAAGWLPRDALAAGDRVRLCPL
jgi:uncharacterized membrane protein (UPF0127 family)